MVLIAAGFKPAAMFFYYTILMGLVKMSKCQFENNVACEKVFL